MTEPLRITLPGNPVTKKNSQRIVTNPRTKRPMILPSAKYKAYEEKCSWAIRFYASLAEPIAKPVNVKCLYFMETARRVDLTNLLEATHDILVKHGVLTDDSSDIIVSTDGSRVLLDRKNPRVEITITEAST